MNKGLQFHIKTRLMAGLALLWAFPYLSFIYAIKKSVIAQHVKFQ